MALQKGGLAPNEAIVVENAPMGVQAGAAAGIFTVAVNTGPIDGQVLLDASKCIIPVHAGFLRQLGELYVKRSNKEIGRFTIYEKRKYFISIVH